MLHEQVRMQNEVTSGAYDVDRVREDFPILSREVYGKKLVYLDNAASAQKPRVVIEALRTAYEEEYANVHRGLHYLSNLATTKYEAARETVRGFLNAASEHEIVFTRGTTEAINLVASSFADRVLNIGEGDEIVLSILEHHSNIVPWHLLRERKGAVLKWAPVDESGAIIMEEYEKLLDGPVKLVALTQMSNALGTITPLKEMIRLAHARGIPVLADGAQSAVHMPVDVQELDCDFFAFSGHKVYGPTGIGALYAKAEHLDAMPPYHGGGEMIAEVMTDHVTYARPPQRFEAGTPAIVQAIGLAAALDYMRSVGRERIAAHEAKLRDYAHERLAAIGGVRIIGTSGEKGSIVSFVLDNAHAHDVSTIIDRAGVAVRAGHHCTQPLMNRFGLTSTARASFAMYNTREEVERLAEALETAKDMLN